MVEHYYTQNPKSPIKPSIVKSTLRGNELTFHTSGGVFSRRKIDLGSELLINKCLIENGDKVLDLGCGYGPVGISIKKAFPECKITLSDVNKRAVKFTKINALENNVKVYVVHGDIYEGVKNEKFDVILVNPPQTAGKDLCNQMIIKAKEHLKKNGNIQLVARHQKGGKEFEKIMQETYKNVLTIAKKSGFRIYLSKNEEK